MAKIFLHKADSNYNLKNAASIKSLINSLFENEKIPLNRIDYIFCSDEFLLQINQTHLNHHTLTDIITFPVSNENKHIQGEIYISIDRIKENAKTYEVLYQNELLRVMIHGALHLCGYKDKSKSQKMEMRSKEDYYLKFYVSREANPH